MDLHQEIMKRSGEYLNSEKFSEAMQAHVENAINEAVKSMFSYGELRDVIRDGLKEKVRIDLDQIEFTHVNQVVTDLVKKKLHGAFNGPMLEKLSSELDDMFQPAPKEITVQGLVDIWKEDLADECGCDNVENILVEIERSSYDRDRSSGTLKIWNGGKKTEKRYYGSGDDRKIDPDLHIYISGGGRKEEGSKIRLIHEVTTRDGKNSLATDIYNKEAQIFMMYCAGTIISDFKDHEDGSDIDTSIGNSY